MNLDKKTRRIFLFGMALALVLGGIALLTGLPASAQGPSGTPCPYGNMMGQGGMMGNGGMMGQGRMSSTQPCNRSSGMMGGGMMGRGMMNFQGSFGPGYGMMGAWTPAKELLPTSGKTLTMDQATAIAKAYVAAWNNQTKLQLNEVMQFSNQFYGEAIETDSKRGAFEFLIDPASGTVYAEPGPNMMWNLRYGGMSSMMGLSTTANDGDKMTVTPDQAVKYAQDYLDKAQPGTKAETTPLAFYGFYTLDFARDGKTVGMLSVNG